jgi:hypothetical protein
MPEGALAGRFASVAQRIRADFESSAKTQHRGSRGTEREEILKHFLSLYLPGTVDVIHNAEIISVDGGISPQCDIVIVDRSTPRLQDMTSHRIVPAECVYGVVEVKSRLSGPELKDACSKIARVKQLTRNAYVDDPSCYLAIGGQTYAIAPVFGLVFAYGGIQLSTLAKRLMDWCLDNPPETHPDGVWIVDKGILAWGSRGGGGMIGRVVESRDRELRELIPYDGRDVLLALIVLTTSLLANVRLPQVMLGDYLAPGVHYRVGTRLTPTEPFN